MSKILLVEDEVSVAQDLVVWFQRDGHVIDVVHNGAEALEWLKAYQYDVIILDFMLPDLDGVSILRLYRLSGGNTPVIMLTGCGETENKELGLDSGADDYVVKPPDLRELSARVRAVLRRKGEVQAPILKLGDINLMTASKKVTKQGQLVDLSPKEYSLLEYFMRHPGIVFSAAELLERVWHSESEASYHTVRVCINRLRQKLFTAAGEDERLSLKTIYGLGYVLEARDGTNA